MKATKFEMYAVRKTGTDDTGKKYDFLAYHTFDNDGFRVDVRFRKECEKTKPDCNAYVIVDQVDWNISTRKKYPILWIAKIQQVIPFATAVAKNKNIGNFETIESVDDIQCLQESLKSNDNLPF